MAASRKKTLDRALARSGAMSRKQAQEAVAAGRVRVNGLRVTDADVWVDAHSDRITLDGAPLVEQRKLYLALHKPKGFVTTRSDERGRKTVYELLGELDRWIAPVGRLDRDTTGLLLFTNDSDWAEHVTNPLTHIEKRYLCTARGELDDQSLAKLQHGTELDDGTTRPARLTLLAREHGRTRFELTIDEGRNRQIRRMLEHVGSHVLELHRLAIGRVTLGGLPSGAHRPLSAREIRSLA